MAKVLIVEDDKTTLDLYAEILRDANHECFLAQDTREARNILEQQTINLIVCDVKLPGENGENLYEEIRAKDPFFPFIFVSGTTDELMVNTDYVLLTKPIEPAHIIAEISRSIGTYQAATSGKKILLVEPDGYRAQVLVVWLGQFGHTCFHCDSIEKAEKFLDNFSELESVIIDCGYSLQDLNRFIEEKIVSELELPYMLLAPAKKGVDVSTKVRNTAGDIVAWPINKIAFEERLSALFNESTKEQEQDASILKIVIIEDDKEIAEFLEDIINKRFTIRTFDSTESAMEAMEVNPPDILICDNILPGEFGLSFIKKYQKFHPEVVSFIMTGLRNEDIIVESFKAGVFGFIAKPLNPDFVSTLLDRAAESIILRKQLKASQDRLVEFEKMAAVGETSATIVHEIGNPITILDGGIKRIRKNVEGKPGTEDIHKMLGVMEKAVNRITRLSRSIRNLAHVSTNEQQSESVFGIVEDAIGLCEAKFAGECVEFSVDGFDKDLTVFCDRVAVSQVLVNLFNNAIHAVEQQDVKEVSLHVADEGHSVVFYVTDSGSGVPEALAQKIFDPFFTTKPVGKGTGIGLSTCKRILQQSRGEIWLDKDEAGRTQFAFRLNKTETSLVDKPA